jgi:hypothetical protein
VGKRKPKPLEIGDMINGDEGKYEILCWGRDRMRDMGIHNLWKKFMYELYSAEDKPPVLRAVTEKYLHEAEAETRKPVHRGKK